jgi:hypothetical protein
VPSNKKVTLIISSIITGTENLACPTGLSLLSCGIHDHPGMSELFEERGREGRREREREREGERGRERNIFSKGDTFTQLIGSNPYLFSA